MEYFPKTPNSLPNLRRCSPISPSSARMLKKIVDTRDVSKLINLSSTVRNIKQSPIGDNFEISYQLTTLRKSLDKYSVLNFQRESRIKELKLKLVELRNKDTVRDEDVQKGNSYKDLKKEIKVIREKEKEEIEQQMILEGMFERMTCAKEFLEKKERKMKREIEKTVCDLNLVSKLRKDVVDSVNQYRIIYKDAANMYEHEKEYLENEITRLENQSKLKKKLIEKTQEHNRHRLEIVELTMIEESSAPLEKMRESHLLHKAFNFLFHKKISNEKVKHTQLENAFLTVSLKTGIHSVDDLIEKFLTQEKNYSQITNEVQIKEQDLTVFNKKLNDLQFKVNILSSKKQFKLLGGDGLKKANEELLKLREKKEELQKVITKISTWIQLNERKVFPDAVIMPNSNLYQKFRNFGVKINKLIQSYVAQGVSRVNENRRKSMKLDEIIQSFKSAKNLRNSALVKPILFKSFPIRKNL